MDTYDAKRVEIIIEAPLERRLTDALNAAGVSGYTV
ncbi:MAG: transcriptional regulator, partial [Pseudomonadota bacterium]